MTEKLIRDRIPEVAAANGDKITARVASPSEYLGLLRAKLIEEANEAAEADVSTLLDELGDVMEVVRELASHYGYDLQAVEDARVAKATRVGGFQEGLVLVCI